MSKSSAPPRPAPRDIVIDIDIDPDLIEEALASVERSARGATPDDRSQLDDAEGIELSVDDPPPAEEARPRVQPRPDERSADVRRLERELARAIEARDALDRQVRDLRKAHGDLSTDFERYRTRSRKDVEEAERRGEERTLRPLIEVYDNVERAWLHAVSDPAQILGGLQIIVEQFKRLLLRLGFERVEADRGMLFDPAQHEAVMHVANDDLLPGTIVDEIHAGFRVRGRLFRPARVTVSAPPPGSRD